jgi:hypothetical protein
VQALELQGQLALALQRSEVSKQMLQGHQARVRAAERRALDALKKDQVKQYATAARDLALRLAVLMAVDQRLGITAFDSAGIGGFRVPSYADLPASDDGAFVSFHDLQALMPEAAKRLDSLLTEEHRVTQIATD